MKKFNQFFKNMGYSYMVDNTFVNIFRLIFWTVITSLLIYITLQLVWLLEYVSPDIWQ